MSAARTRRRGAGSVTTYKTKGGTRWRWQVLVPVDEEQPGAGTKTAGKGGYLAAKDANEAMVEFNRLSKLRGAPLKTSGIPLVSVFAAQWLAGLRLAPSTIYGYQKIVRNHIVPQLGALRVDQVSATGLKAHYTRLMDHGRADGKDLGGPLSANTVNKIHIVIGAILEAAMDDGFIATNPARRKKVVKAPTGREIRASKPEIQTWTAAELTAFLVWDRDVFQDDLYTLWFLIAMTGIRRSEAIAVRWEDLDLVSGKGRLTVRRAADTITRGAVKPTKTYRPRVIDLDDETVAALRSWRTLNASISLDRARPYAYLFAGPSGELRSANEVGARWSRRIAAFCFWCQR